MRVYAALLLLILGLMLGVQPGPSEAKSRRCPVVQIGGARLVVVVTSGTVTCKRALRVARRWYRAAKDRLDDGRHTHVVRTSTGRVRVSASVPGGRPWWLVPGVVAIAALLVGGLVLRNVAGQRATQNLWIETAADPDVVFSVFEKTMRRTGWKAGTNAEGSWGQSKTNQPSLLLAGSGAGEYELRATWAPKPGKPHQVTKPSAILIRRWLFVRALRRPDSGRTVKRRDAYVSSLAERSPFT
jgi:hypothetical protein